ncbi:MAG: VWA domain-containing protein [Acidobacteriota bacterium]
MSQKHILGVSLLTVVLNAAFALPLAKAQDHTVKLDVVVRDGADNPVAGLKQTDFLVSDNGSAQALSSFADVSQDKTPPTVVLVFDLINNSEIYATLLREQLTKVLLQNGGKLKYPTLLIVATPTDFISSQTPTTNGNALARALAQVPVGPNVNERLTGEAGALHRENISTKALNETLGSTGKLPGRKLIFWLSHGWGLMGGLPVTPGQEKELFSAVKQYSSGMRQARITLYKLNTQGASASVNSLQEYRQFLKGVNALNQTDFADMSLDVIATQSGGLVLNSNDLAVMYDRCLKDADGHYEIEFPEGAATKNVAFHEVQVRVNRPGAAARTRNGYYPQ